MAGKEAWPTEDAATKAVDAAARVQWENIRQAYAMDPHPQFLPEFDLLPAAKRLEVRQTVLPTIWEALKALPDPRYAAWAEGYAAGSSDTAFESEGSGNPPGLVYPHENPYPSGL